MGGHSLPPASVAAPRLAWRPSGIQESARTVPEETAVSLTYNRSSYAVMMATPRDIEDLALGFSLSEGIIDTPSQLTEIEVIRHPSGLEARMWLDGNRKAALERRRRHIAGPSGCGLCGLDSLEAANRMPRQVASTLRMTPGMIAEAMAALPEAQDLHRATAAVHGAAFWRPGQGLRVIREDIGRHNALDKLIGAMVTRGEIASDGALLLTSRVSVEMVQKAAVLGTAIVVAVSAPSALALRVAERAGIALVAVARAGSFEVFTHCERLDLACR